MVKLFKHIDFTSRDFKFTINGDSFKTTVGGFFSIFHLLIFIALAYYFSIDIFRRDNPNIFSKTEYLEENTIKIVNFNSSNFEFNIGVNINAKDYVHNESYFYLVEETVHRQNHPEIKIVESEVFYNSNESKLNNDMLKISKSKKRYSIDENFDVGGGWLYDYIKYTTYYLRRCDAIAENYYKIKCASREEIEKIFGKSYINFFYTNMIVIPDNFENSTRLVEMQDNFKFNPFNTERINYDIFYSHAVISSDVGWFNSVNENKEFIQFDKKDMYSGKLSDIDYLIAFRIFTNNKILIYRRTYVRVQDIIANLMGTSEMIKSFILIICSNMFDTSYKFYLIKHLLKTELNESPVHNVEIQLQRIEPNNKNLAKLLNDESCRDLNMCKNNISVMDSFDSKISAPNLDKVSSGNKRNLSNKSSKFFAEHKKRDLHLRNNSLSEYVHFLKGRKTTAIDLKFCTV